MSSLARSEDDKPLTVKVRGVYILEGEQSGNSPVVLLEDDSGRLMPLFVGLAEAISIHQALSGEVSARPMTHDLFISALENLNSMVDSVLIDDLEGGVYYARLCIRRDEDSFEMDARPSDCLALALRQKSPIRVNRKVIEEACISRSDIEGLKSLDVYLHDDI
jgi:bifunctional DNase/RNase